MTIESQTLQTFSLIIIWIVYLYPVYDVSGFGCGRGIERSCGRVNISRPLIKDGNPAVRGEWPFIAALHKREQSNFFCGGTLITNQHVLTAAHCIQQKSSSIKLSASDLTVRLGAHNLTDKCESGMEERNVSDIHVHPQYNPYVTEYDADIAILELNEKVAFTIYIQPICMPSNVVVDDVKGTIVGWGIANNEDIEQIPQFTVTKILNASYCYKQDPAIIAWSSSNTFCGGEGNGTPNKGDSGGGIFGIYNCSWEQYGVISAVRSDSTGYVSRDSFAIYTNLKMFQNWIIDTAKTDDDMNITLTCHFIPLMFNTIYKCFLYDLDIRGNNTEIDSFSDSHLAGKSNRDVEVVQFHNGTMLFIPNGIGKFFINLKILLVGYSSFSYLGTKLIQRSNFKDLFKLKKLSVYRNDIADLAEDSLWDLQNLENFHLSYNKLKILDERTFEKNLKLKLVTMRSNEISFLPKDLFKNNFLLESVDFSSNCLTSIDENTFVFNEKLENLFLYSNQLKVLPTKLFFNNLLLNIISLGRNSIKVIDENVFQRNEKLESLHMGNNQVEFLPKKLFKNNLMLYYVSFINNSLKIIDIDFTESETFYRIDFHNNSCINAEYHLKGDRFRESVSNNLTEFQNLIKENCQRLN